MCRAAILCCVALASATAAANPEAEKVVRASIAAAFTGHAAIDKTAADSLTFGVTFHPAIFESGTQWHSDKAPGGGYAIDSVMMWGRDPIEVSAKVAPFKPLIVVDEAAGAGWFAADVKVTAVLRTGEKHTHDEKGTWPVRVTGVIVDGKNGWKVAAQKFSLSVSDAKLAKLANQSSPYYGTIETKVEREIAAWFSTQQLAAHQSSRASDVNGTARTEVARTKAAIAKLVAGWDKLAWKPHYVRFTELVGGKVAWAHVDLMLAMRGGEKRMSVGIVAVREDGRWKWVSLNWSPEVLHDDADH